MHPPDCPEWDYETYPNARQIVRGRAYEVLTTLPNGDTLAVAVNTRQAHGHMFHELTPPTYDYFAGHYRGENFRCLLFYEVGTQGDPRVGAPPASVDFLTRRLADEIRAGITGLDTNALLTPKDKLRYIAALACHAFVAFLTIHPYANGNGHAARLILWSIFCRYGYWPRHWPVEPRPPNPPYVELIVRHRDGDAEPLERYLLQGFIA